jgi:hypothetical protein
MKKTWVVIGLVAVMFLGPKQARMRRQITVDVGGRKTGRNCDQLVSLSQTEGIPLPSIV